MFLNNSYGRVVDIVHRTMDVTSLRRNVIADNIANSDTPNFKRSTINFEAQLQRAFESQKRPGLGARMTNDKHIPFYQPIDYRSVGPRKVLDYLTTSKPNGNNVDIEEEMMLSLKNQLNYQLFTQIISDQFNQISTAIR